MYNGFGECQLGVVFAALLAGEVTERACPYFTPTPEDAGV